MHGQLQSNDFRVQQVGGRFVCLERDDDQCEQGVNVKTVMGAEIVLSHIYAM